MVTQKLKTYDEYNFTPTEALVLETLTARYRLGENVWTFSTQANKALKTLTEKQIIDYKSGIVENSSLVWFTDLGKALMLSFSYQIPLLSKDDPQKFATQLTKNAQELKEKFKNN